MTRKLSLFVVPVLVAACGSTSTKLVQTPRFYGYTTQSSASLDREPPPTPPDKASDAIKRLRRVAFVPPDTCLDMRAADTSSTVDKRVIRMQCGVTMSELEHEAEKVGFDVVTWQSLKGAQKPLDQAREQKIDLLFEVNELDVIEEFDRAESSEFRYFIGDTTGHVEPLEVTAQDNAACQAYHARNAPKISGMTSVLDLKMVQVSTGSVLWSYRHVENAKAEEASALVRFPVMARQKYRTSRPWWPWLVVGGGIVIAAVGQPLAGAVVAGVGGIGVISLPKSTHEVGEPEYEGVSAVLCRRPHVVDAPVPGPTPQEVRSTSFKEQRKVSAKDASEERRRVLIRTSVQIFMKQLTGPKPVL
ncbi:MAG TPA: hypothetical protein VFQ53_07925 [Kofleriaceae bacterium]|nr:hypothetical protein [Kofleriaceae bacterium]